MTKEQLFRMIGLDSAGKPLGEEHQTDSTDRAATSALISLYERQTEDEQESQGTRYRNGVGFNGTDAAFLSSLAEQAIENRGREKAGLLGSRRVLTDKQVYCVRKCIGKYSGQLLEIAAEKAAARARAKESGPEVASVESGPAESGPVELGPAESVGSGQGEGVVSHDSGQAGGCSDAEFMARWNERREKEEGGPAGPSSEEIRGKRAKGIALAMAAAGATDEEIAVTVAAIMGAPGPVSVVGPVPKVTPESMGDKAASVSGGYSHLIREGDSSYRWKTAREYMKESRNRHGVPDELTGVVNWEERMGVSNPSPNGIDPFCESGSGAGYRA